MNLALGHPKVQPQALKRRIVPQVEQPFGMALMTDSPPVRIQFANEFKVELRTLAKRYRQIRADIQPLIEQLQAGELPGDQIPGTSYTIRKVRVKNSDVRKGKSAG
jgi:mRNA-degrading endonuclease RelE of RelBE toxin-antitoxin system